LSAAGAYTDRFLETEPTRADVEGMAGAVLLEFGAPWCGFCTAAQPHIASAMRGRGGLTHLKIEDGKGRPLGRSFAVRLWPTLVLLQDGREVGRTVRPGSAAAVAQLLDQPGPD
jgi:thioredoxin 1